MKLLILPFLLLSTLSYANQVVDCKDADVDLRSLVVPIADNARSFLNDEVQLYKIDQIEPACCAVGVAVVMTDAQSEVPGDTKCFAVLGYTDVSIAKTDIVFSRSRGTLLIIPATTYDHKSMTGEGIGTELILKLDLPNSSISILE